MSEKAPDFSGTEGGKKSSYQAIILVSTKIL